MTPSDLFGNQIRYTVPLFQRPYVWTQDRQWEPLWEDVRTVAERLLEVREHGGSSEAIPHFLGAIVLDQKLVPTGYIQERHVIDGQQRLTTLQLLLDAAHEVAVAHGTESDAASLRGLVLNDSTLAKAPHQVFKVWPTNYDRDAFAATMADGTAVPKELAATQVAKAHSYFKNVIIEWTEPDGDPEQVRTRLNVLASALRDHLKLVVIDLERGDNAQVIFETLNHRGTPLLAADLIKNFIFRQADADGVDVEALYETRWKRFDSEYWRTEITQGRLRKPRVDIFFNYWLVMRTAREVPADRVFTDFVAYVQSATPNLEEVVSDLHHHADVFENIYRHYPPHSAEGQFVYRVLQVMDQGVLTPVLMWLLGQPDSSVEEGQIEKALGALESWLIRRMVCRLTAQSLNRVLLEMIDRLTKSKNGRPGDDIIEFLLGLRGDSQEWPSDERFIESAATDRLYTAITRARLRMLLEALEDARRSPKSEEEHCVKWSLTIEHLMPQGWREHWPLRGEDHQAVESERRDRLIHTLGNLTLVTNRLNPALSNRPWTNEAAVERGLGEKGKRSLIDEHSVLRLNREVVNDHPESWNEVDIEERCRMLAGDLVRIWPRPVSKASGNDDPAEEE